MPTIPHTQHSLFDLSTDELTASVYYGAAGIDIQPLLRFGDMATDFIYVNAGLDCNQFISGVQHCVTQLADAHPNFLGLTGIFRCSPPPGPLILNFPEFMSSGQREVYMQVFGPYSREAGSCSLLLTFDLHVGNITRSLRLWHLNGEAIATYDRLFLRKKLAPKVLITIQAGLLERPGYFMNAMLAWSSIRPKVWVRGVWSSCPYEIYTDQEVFEPVGIYDLKIWESRGWDASFGYHIHGTTHKNFTYRHVAGYGERSFWNEVAPVGSSQIITGRSLKIRKRNEPFVHHLHSNYTRRDNLVLNDHLNLNLPCRGYFMLDRLRNCEYDQAVAFGITDVYHAYSIAHEHFESHELYADQFAAHFLPTNGVQLDIDIFYKWPLEFQRHF